MNKRISSCTTILVGKKASLDGSTLIARNEDGYNKPNPQKFRVIQPADQPVDYTSAINGLKIKLPTSPLRYTSTPDADDQYGIWAGAGINSANVAMTACETITNNPHILAIDPLTDDGIGEADFVTLVLPYSQSARQAVLRLGQLLETYGTYETNGIAFSDHDEVWYLETIGGHHWAAIRIPDNAFVVAPNRLNIAEFDFTSPNTLFSEDLPSLIVQYHLNPDEDQVNLRHIFGTATIKDSHYNNPRAYAILKAFGGLDEGDYEDQELPFMMVPTKKLTIEAVKWALSSHFENTPFDPYGTGSKDDRQRYRTIGLNRNEETHILQIRNDVPEAIAGIHWLAFGPNTFNGLVPFYANTNTTPAIYRETQTGFDPNNIYWLNRLTALLGDTDFNRYQGLRDAFEAQALIDCRKIQLKTDAAILANPENSTAQLTVANQALADTYFMNLNQLLGKMVTTGANHMKLRYSLND